MRNPNGPRPATASVGTAAKLWLAALPAAVLSLIAVALVWASPAVAGDQWNRAGIAILLFCLGIALSLMVWMHQAWKEAHRAGHEAHIRLKRATEEATRYRGRARELAVLAKSAKAIRNEFLSSISHEVRTPMNTIMGMTDLALQTDDPSRRHRYLENVRRAADALLSLLNDLLDLSKLHARQLQLNPVEFHLRGCVTDIVNRFHTLAEQKGLGLNCEVADDVPDLLVGDPGRLRQTIAALLSNAVKFTAQGHIDVHVGLESRRPDAVTLNVAVADTGIGIRHENQSAIFEAFRQADGSLIREHGGCGIGLANRLITPL